MKVTISKGEKITFERAKGLVEKSERMIRQNNSRSLIVEIDKVADVDVSAIELFSNIFNIEGFSTTIKRT